MDGLERLFLANLNSWKEHCEEVAHSSFVRDSLDCDAYINIVGLGREFLPFIKKYADEIPVLGLAPLVSGIVGDVFQIPEEMRGNVQEMKNYTVDWLEENIAKYI